MGKFDQLLEKIGWGQVQEEEENEEETYEEPKSAVYSSARSAMRSSNEIHFTSDEPAKEPAVIKPHKAAARQSYREDRRQSSCQCADGGSGCESGVL